MLLNYHQKFHRYKCLSSYFHRIIYLQLAIFFLFFLYLRHKRIVFSVHVTCVPTVGHRAKARVDFLYFKGIVELNMNIDGVYKCYRHTVLRGTVIRHSGGHGHCHLPVGPHVAQIFRHSSKDTRTDSTLQYKWFNNESNIMA